MRNKILRVLRVPLFCGSRRAQSQLVDGPDNSGSNSRSLPEGAPAVIAVVTDAMYPYFMGGKEVLYHHVTSGLSRRGMEVHLYTMDWWGGPSHKVESGIHYHALCRKYELYHNERRSIFEAVMFAFACFRMIGGRYDLIYADHMPHLQLFTLRVVASIRRVPLVVTVHEVWGLEYWRKYLGPLGFVAAAIENATVRLPDHLITVSDENARELVSRGVSVDRVTVIPPGIDLEKIIEAPPAIQHYDFIFVGRLLEHKRVEQLIEGIATLKKEGIEATCAIVGEGPEQDSLNALSAHLDLEDQITFIPKIFNHEGVFSLVKSATVFVLPSVREGYGIVVAEAIACGTPVITTNHAGNRSQDLVEDGVTGWVCAPTREGVTQSMRDAMTGGAPSRMPSLDARSRNDWISIVSSLTDVFATASRERDPNV